MRERRQLVSSDPGPVIAHGRTRRRGRRERPRRGEPIGIATGAGSIWVVNSEFQTEDPGSVSRIDPGTAAVTAMIPVGLVPLEVAVGEGAVWVSNSRENTVSRIDAARV